MFKEMMKKFSCGQWMYFVNPPAKTSDKKGNGCIVIILKM